MRSVVLALVVAYWILGVVLPRGGDKLETVSDEALGVGEKGAAMVVDEDVSFWGFVVGLSLWSLAQSSSSSLG